MSDSDATATAEQRGQDTAARSAGSAKSRGTPRQRAGRGAHRVSGNGAAAARARPARDTGRMKNKDYLKELKRLQGELVKVQLWAKHTGAKIVVIFEGRDAAGKGGVIKA